MSVDVQQKHGKVHKREKKQYLIWSCSKKEGKISEKQFKIHRKAGLRFSKIFELE